MIIENAVSKVKNKLQNNGNGDLYEVIKKHNGVIAGGCLRDSLRNKEFNDIDVYFFNKNDFNSCIEEIELKESSITANVDPDNNNSYRKIKCDDCTFDLILCESSTDIESLLNKFDFNINRVAFCPKEDILYIVGEEFIFGTGMFKDVLRQYGLKDDLHISNDLKLNKNLNPFQNVTKLKNRLKRFINSGYSISFDDLDIFKTVVKHLEEFQNLYSHEIDGRSSNLLNEQNNNMSSNKTSHMKGLSSNLLNEQNNNMSSNKTSHMKGL